MIRPQLWPAKFRPRFERLCGVARDARVKVFMHSCGTIGAIVPGTIDVGVGVLQFDQPKPHGLDALADYQDVTSITFWSPVDIQKTLQRRNETVTTAKAREMLDQLWRGRGGFVTGRYEDDRAIGLDPRHQDAASRAFIEHDRSAQA